MGRRAGWQDQHRIERESAVRGDGRVDVSRMHGIERATKDTDARAGSHSGETVITQQLQLRQYPPARARLRARRPRAARPGPAQWPQKQGRAEYRPTAN